MSNDPLAGGLFSKTKNEIPTRTDRSIFPYFENIESTVFFWPYTLLGFGVKF